MRFRSLVLNSNMKVSAKGGEVPPKPQSALGKNKQAKSTLNNPTAASSSKRPLSAKPLTGKNAITPTATVTKQLG
jgi:hypothetical protein